LPGWSLPSPRFTVAALAGLLVVEGLALGIVFDTHGLQALGVYWWGRLLSFITLVPQVALAAATGVAILGAGRVSATFAAERTADGRGRRWPYLAGHALMYVAFVFVTQRVLGPGQPDQGKPRWILPWLLTGAAAVLMLLPAATGARTLVAIVRRFAPALAAGVVVGLGAWTAGAATRSLWQPLSRGTLLGTYGLLRLVRSDAFVRTDALVVGLPEFSVEVRTSCAGYEGIGLLLVFLTGFLLAFRRQLRLPRALVLFPIGIVVVWLGNILRVATLLLVGTVSPSIALGGFHSYAGSLLFCVLSLGLVYLARRWTYLRREAGSDAGPPGTLVETGGRGAAVEPYVLPLVAVLATGLVTGLLGAGGVDWFYPARVVVAAAILWRYRRDYRTLLGGGSWIFVPLGLTVFAIWLALVPTAPARDVALVTELRGVHPSLAAGWMLLRALGAVAVAPIVEELAFRGYLLRRLSTRDFDAAPYPRRLGFALLASSVLFGLLHGEVVPAAVAGVIYGLAAGFRGRLRDAIAAHALTNLLLVVWGSVWGRWSLWL
jgi:exosortase E/protease (VPEID-CTERM system)